MSNHTPPTSGPQRLPVFEWRAAVMGEGDLTSACRVVAYHLSGYMDATSLGNARPGTERLATEAGLSVRTVKASLACLVRAEWLTLVQRGGRTGGRRWASVYKGRFPTGRICTLTDPQGANDDHHRVQNFPSGSAGFAPHLEDLPREKDLDQPLVGAEVWEHLAQDGWTDNEGRFWIGPRPPEGTP